MICRDFPLLYSAQLDGHAAEHDQFALQRHLRECAMCRRSAAEMRSLRADLRALAAPLPNPDLTGQIQKRLRLEASQRAEALVQVGFPRNAGRLAGAGISWVEFRKFWFNSFANWLDGRRAKIFSQSVGAIVSLLLFFVVVTEVFNQARDQAYRTLTLAALATQTILDPNDEALREQAILKTYLLPTPPPPPLNSNDELEGVVASLREEDVILTAEVRKDGSSTIIFARPLNDPSVEAKLSTAMAQAGTFQSASRTRNTSNVAVVYLSSITTTARL
ncbi:MAG: hypothetical protein MOB07_09155 [Acidobacteria bacterium]|nr:hypothetical protein [Acidobacteriota bacterium]